MFGGQTLTPRQVFFVFSITLLWNGLKVIEYLGGLYVLHNNRDEMSGPLYVISTIHWTTSHDLLTSVLRIPDRTLEIPIVKEFSLF